MGHGCARRADRSGVAIGFDGDLWRVRDPRNAPEGGRRQCLPNCREGPRGRTLNGKRLVNWVREGIDHRSTGVYKATCPYLSYTLRKDAYWHDGVPVTVDDILWTFDAYKSQASNSWRSAYRDIKRMEQTGPWSFKFHFTESAETTGHLIIQTALFAPQAKHYYEHQEFDATTMEPPLGNGPYWIAEVDPGHKLVFERTKDYWAKDLSITKGMYNFDRIQLYCFFDESVMLQALRAGAFDFHRDQNEKSFSWTAYYSGISTSYPMDILLDGISVTGTDSGIHQSGRSTCDGLASPTSGGSTRKRMPE